MERETKVVGVGNGAEEHQIAPPITVNWSTLVEGIGITFSGVAKILTALEPHMTQTIFEMVEAERERLQKKDDSSKGSSDSSAGDVNNAPSVDGNAPAIQSNTAHRDERIPAPQCSANEPSITMDDIIKVIVRKIKQDRSNNEKIGAILKTHGVCKVSELTADQYEAFMTELAQL